MTLMTQKTFCFILFIIRIMNKIKYEEFRWNLEYDSRRLLYIHINRLCAVFGIVFTAAFAGDNANI